MDRLVGSYRLPVLVGAGATASALGVLALVGTLPPALLVAWFAAFGFLSAYGPVLIAHGKSLFPPTRSDADSPCSIWARWAALSWPRRSADSSSVFSRNPGRRLRARRLPLGLCPAGGFYPIGLLAFISVPATPAGAGKQRRTHEASARPAWKWVNSPHYCLLRFVRCGVCYCGAVALSRYRRPPWAFPP